VRAAFARADATADAVVAAITGVEAVCVPAVVER
jgi:hypothetical protein